jgi:hypothetical protein
MHRVIYTQSGLLTSMSLISAPDHTVCVGFRTDDTS